MPVTLFEKITIIIKDSKIGVGNGKKPKLPIQLKPDDKDYQVMVTSKVVERTIRKR